MFDRTPVHRAGCALSNHPVRNTAPGPEARPGTTLAVAAHDPDRRRAGFQGDRGRRPRRRRASIPADAGQTSQATPGKHPGRCRAGVTGDAGQASRAMQGRRPRRRRADVPGKACPDGRCREDRIPFGSGSGLSAAPNSSAMLNQAWHEPAIFSPAELSGWAESARAEVNVLQRSRHPLADHALPAGASPDQPASPPARQSARQSDSQTVRRAGSPSQASGQAGGQAPRHRGRKDLEAQTLPAPVVGAGSARASEEPNRGPHSRPHEKPVRPRARRATACAPRGPASRPPRSRW